MSVEIIKSEQAYTLRRSEPPAIEWTVDFRLPAYQQRMQQRGRRRDPLAKAVGLSKHDDLRILDMTAGLGKDAYWLAVCGAQVLLLERNPLLAECLSRAVQLLQEDPEQMDIGNHMQVQCIDALAYLAGITPDQFDVAYFDPMFPARKKSALVKKDMQIMQALHAEDVGMQDLIETVLEKVPKLVVKRPAHAAFLEGREPHHQIQGEKIRFDVYA
jgi:16S rRNA (guanine1516-N2)-methyltransferase